MSLRYSLGEIILTVTGFLIGIVFWSFFYQIAFGGIAWAVFAIIIYAYCLKNGIEKSVD